MHHPEAKGKENDQLSRNKKVALKSELGVPDFRSVKTAFACVSKDERGAMTIP